MKPLLLTFGLAFLPLLFGMWVNASAPLPTRAYVPNCTRYCAGHAYHHTTAANSPAYFMLRLVYAATGRELLLGGWARYAAVKYWRGLCT